MVGLVFAILYVCIGQCVYLDRCMYVYGRLIHTIRYEIKKVYTYVLQYAHLWGRE